MKNLSEDMFAALLDWYEENKRVLPWRGTKDPYEVWISEIMLQQTRVETVKAYFVRWLDAFPTVYDLAEAPEEAVLKLWEGLGYYSRARNLHRAAKMVADVYGGQLPCDKKALQKLPGIGAYTAGAILSIAFGKAEPAVDGNVLRVVSRLTADPFDISKEDVRAAVADDLRPFMPAGKTSEFTQALFELGALVCLPDADYRCSLCPLTTFCEAFRQNAQKNFPVKMQKKEKKVQRLTVFLLACGDAYALKKRPDKGLLAGLYEFPNTEGFLSEEDVAARYGGEISPLPDASHVFTHIVWQMKGYLVRVAAPPAEEGLFFATPEEIAEKYSLPSAFAAYKKFCRR